MTPVLRKLGDICEINPSKTEMLNRPDNLKVGFLAMADVSEDAEIIGWQTRTLSEVKSGFTFFKDGDVLVAKITPCMENGKGALVENAINGVGFGSTEFYVLRVDPRYLVSKYLYYIVSDKIFRNRASAFMFGSGGQQRLSKTYIEKLKIPVPSLEQQRFIVEQLDKIKTAKKLNDRLIENSDELFKTLLYTEFSSKYKDGKTLRLGDLANIKGGGTPPRHTPENFKGDIPWVTVKDLNRSEIKDAQEHVNERSIQSSAANLVPPETTLVATRVGLGKVAISKRELTFNQDIKGLIPKENINPYFLYYSMVFLAPKIERQGVGATVKGVTQDFLKDLEIPYLNMREQERIVSKLYAAQTYAAKLLQKKELSEEFFTTILARSLTGEPSHAEKEEKVNKFALQQAIAAVLQQFERGEMVLAKVLYIAQEIYQVPLGFRFAAQHFGPYDTEIKKALMAGMSTYNRFFTRKGTGVYVLGANAEKLFKYHSKVLGSMTAVLNDLLPYIKNADSSSIECLATVCKIMQDNKTTDLEVIKLKMYEWKKDRFSGAQIKGAYEFAISKGWDKKLMT